MELIEVVLILGGVFASTGFWNFIIYKLDKRSATANLLLSVSAEIIVSLGNTYRRRGSLTLVEYKIMEDMHRDYKALGGNGLVDRVFREINNLPIIEKV